MSGEQEQVIASPNPTVKQGKPGDEPKRVESKPVEPDSSATTEPMRRGGTKPKPRE